MHIDVLNQVNNSSAYFPIIEKLLQKARYCEAGKIGPNRLIRTTIQNDGLPDPIVRKYYSNMDFLIPAWCRYNSKGSRSRITGVLASEIDADKFMVLKGRKYRLYVPTIKDLLVNTDLSCFLSGFGVERVVWDSTQDGLARNNINYLHQLQKDSANNLNAILLETTASYTEIAAEAYKKEGLSEGEIDVVAKALREFNFQIRNKDDVNVGGARIYDTSQLGNKIIIPIDLKLLGIRRQPIKATIEYTFELN